MRTQLAADRKRARENTAAVVGARSGRALATGEDQCGTCPERTAEKRPYRVFISYSHENASLAQALSEHLNREGLLPVMDPEIRIGEAFSEEIQDMIERAHVFMPLVTPEANKRLWVQQEIGYAIAMHVPLCPIAVGGLPSGMAERIQGLQIAKGPDLIERSTAIFRERLKYEVVDDLVRRARGRRRQGRYDCASHWLERQQMLVSFLDTAYREGCRLVRGHGRWLASRAVRQDTWRLRIRAAFGSFSIPDEHAGSAVWEIRDPGRYLSSEERCLLRAERRLADAYMKCFGCDLIIDPRLGVMEADPDPSDRQNPRVIARGAVAARETKPKPQDMSFKHNDLRTACRLRLLIRLLQTYRNSNLLRVVIPKREGLITTNQLMAGDWFAAEAVVPYHTNRGYEQTVFTRHAPAILNQVDQFDRDFGDFLEQPIRAANHTENKGQVLERLRAWLHKIELRMRKRPPLWEQYRRLPL